MRKAASVRESALWRHVKLATVIVLGIAFLWYGCVPQWNGRRLEIGDSRARAIRLLGEPELVFGPDRPAHRSYLNSYDFYDLHADGDILSPRELPNANQEALWFPYASAGHLVYIENGEIAAVYWGGT